MAATSLQKQLAAIAASSTHQLNLKAQKLAHGKSLLFEPRVAASQSFESVYIICYEGFRNLCAIDPRFVHFSQSLFSEQSKTEDRTQMTKKENEKLDTVLEAFITMVGPRLLLKPAEKALEWLVRRFRVHEYNTECLVFTYLPYHSSPQFLALLSILPSEPKKAWRFLQPYIQSPTNPPRRAIIYTAINTPAFFNALQNYMVRVLEAGHHESALISFWSSVTTQAINGILERPNTGKKEVRDENLEDLLLRLLPVLNSCMRPSNGTEAVTACYMIVIVLATKASIGEKVLDSLLEAVVISQTSETLDAGLICAAVVAEERSQMQLPALVSKRILRLPNLTRELARLSAQYCISRLTLGIALACLERIEGSEDYRVIFKEVVDSNLLERPHLTLVISALLRLLEQSKTSPLRGQLIDYISSLSDSTAISQTLEAAAKSIGVNLEALGLTIGSSLEGGTMQPDDEDEEMVDADESEEGSLPLMLPPEIREISFLAWSASESFAEAHTAFEQAVASKRTQQFLHASSLCQEEAFQTPLYFTFLTRVWCSGASSSTRAAALHSAMLLIKSNGGSTDLQHLMPYLAYALADPSNIVRRSAVACISLLSAQAQARKGPNVPIWGSAGLFGNDTTKLPSLSAEQVSALFSVMVPMLEECTMDAKIAIPTLREALEGAQTAKYSKNGLKTSIRSTIANFFGSHMSHTPLLRVRIRLLSLFDSPAKSFIAVRANKVIPAIKFWCGTPPKEVKAMCENQMVDIVSAEQAHIMALVPKEAESVYLLKDIISGHYDGRTQLLDAAFDWLVANWPTLRSDSRPSLCQQLLDLSLQENGSGASVHGSGRFLEVLRTIDLNTVSLNALLDSVPSSAQMPGEPPVKKRRRTSRSEMVRAELQSPQDVARVLRRLTRVLELIESSGPAKHHPLFKNLFAVLGEIQQLRQQANSDLVYLQSLVLGSLTPMANRIKTERDATEYQACVRADLLVDCIRHSASPQVQNAALLLIATLASWVPELILHNLMPIFTFIGSTLLRQEDDYSAHVVDQTISRVVPPLAASLRAKHKHFLTGVADLLLSFTAAFEHIPQHRRLKLFSELARTLGPEDSLSAIIALLVDRYPRSEAQYRFVIDILVAFEPIAALQAFKGYLELVDDATGKKGKISETLFSLGEKQAGQVEVVLMNLLSSLTDFAADDRLRSHISRSFGTASEPSQPRAVFATIVETIIQISKKAAKQAKLYQCCAQVLSKCLNLLPTSDLVKSTELLLANPDHEVKVAAIKAVEVRAGAVTQQNKASVSALLGILSSLDTTLQQVEDLKVKRVAIGCIDSIIARFGKKDTEAVALLAQTIAGPQSLCSSDNDVRILSLLCLTSAIDVLEDEAISLLPAMLPKAFEYLGTAIEEESTGLHNAVYALLSNTVDRLGFMFSRDYLVPALRLSQQSAADGLDDACDGERIQFYQTVSRNLEAQEIFIAIKTTWADAIRQGFEATEEQLALILSTIECQTKSKLVKSSSTLFSLLLETFKLRDATKASSEDFEDDEVEQLEAALIETILSMTLKLNDATFRPFFSQLVDMAASSSVTFYRFLAAFFDKFKSIVTSYASYIIEHASRLLESLAKDKSGSQLRTALLAALQKSFEHDQDGFWQAPSHFSAIMPPLLAQLTVPNTPSSLDTIVAFAAALSSSSDNHRDMNNVLLKYMRAEDAHTRLATVRCEQELTRRLGEEWLGLLPEMLPFIAELREDDDEMVERETQRWIGSMEEILGESLEGMLQ